MTLFQHYIINHQLSMQLILPFVVGDTVTDLFVFKVADQKDIVELIRDEILEVFDFLGSKQTMISCRINLEYLIKKII